MSEQPDWNAEVNEALVLFSKRLVMVQGEYNAHQKLSLTQKHAEDAQAEALAKIKAATLDALPEKLTDDGSHEWLGTHPQVLPSGTEQERYLAYVNYAFGNNFAIDAMIESLK